MNRKLIAPALLLIFMLLSMSTQAQTKDARRGGLGASPDEADTEPGAVATGLI
jgi:hypothetical protein